MSTTQSHAFQLQIPLPKLLTSQEELALYRAALRGNPQSPAIRFSLASQLLKANEFDEVVELLHEWKQTEPRFLELQAEALMSRETEAANREVKRLCMEGLAAEPGDDTRWRPNLLSTLAKAHIRLGELDEARACLREALHLNAGEKDAYKRAVALDLRERRPDAVLDLAGGMISGGIAHSRVLCSQSLALAQLGMIDEARQALGLDTFLAAFEPAPPEGWNSLADFNRALEDEMHSHPDVRYNRYGTASAHTWRIDEPSLKRSKLFPALQQMISREIQAYVARLPKSGHPFVENPPSAASLRNWVVITEGDGHETWHVHQNGWLSGVYYIHVQDHIANGTGPEGCIAFGLPEDLVGHENAAAFGEVLARPRTGLMMIFPSHTYHRTYPHHGSGRRICYAFDTIPEQPVAEPVADERAAVEQTATA
jgi:tetratricopeptide (TPR) repeat protein